MAKEVTLEKISQLIVEGFEKTDKRFDKVEGRLERVEGRLERVEKKVDRIEVEIKNVRTDLKEKAPLADLTALERRVTLLETQIQRA